MSPWEELECRRSEYRDRMRERDGYSASQQIALATLHNQQVGHGSTMAICVLISKPTLRALLARGAITSDGKLTRTGDDILIKWMREDHANRVREKR